MAIDDPLERLLEEFDIAKRKLDTRAALIREALDELPHAESVALENYLGFGKSLRLNDDVRDALRSAAEEELAALRENIEAIRERIMERRLALAEVPQA